MNWVSSVIKHIISIEGCPLTLDVCVNTLLRKHDLYEAEEKKKYLQLSFTPASECVSWDKFKSRKRVTLDSYASPSKLGNSDKNKTLVR